jgi:hypothetical protein
MESKLSSGCFCLKNTDICIVMQLKVEIIISSHGL